MAAEDRVTEPAPAKINLYLHITGRRDDGYHLLDSLVVFSDFGDLVTAERSSTFSLTHVGAYADQLPRPEDNLVLRAATTLAKAFDVTDAVALTLEKNLPVASGIGGGSADAAATLRACCRLWGVDAAHCDVVDLALSLGADVPVCLTSQSAIMRGIGEKLTLVSDLPPLYLVMVNRGEALSTAAVFQNRAPEFSSPYHWAPVTPGAAGIVAALQNTKNDLEPSAINLKANISETLHQLDEMTGCQLARMSGSGATCFGIFAAQSDAEQAARRLKTLWPSAWVVACQTRQS